MHIVEGYLPLRHAVGWTVAALPFVVGSARALSARVSAEPAQRMRLAASGAFVLLLSSLKLPSLAGSSAHPTGTGLGSILVGARCMPVMAGLVLLFQAILLAHGGLTTWGANVFSLGVVGPWVAVGTFRAVSRVGVSTPVAVGIAAAFADLATYACTALQLAWAFPGAAGIPDAFVRFALVFGVTQFPLAALEGVFSAMVWKSIAPEPQPRRQPSPV
jgi:cobalt/nickel transport system permease protein